jgi:predicted amidophosphoribosyltransferase
MVVTIENVLFFYYKGNAISEQEKGIGQELGICYYCMKETDDIEDGLCKECRGQ